MRLREITPWRWGGLRRFERDEEPFGNFRRQMESLYHEMDRMFAEMPGHRVGRPFFTQDWGMVMPEIDEVEDDKGFHISVELPGMDEEDVDITLAGRLLTIRGEKKVDDEEEGKDFYRRERSYGTFKRTLELPGDVDESAIKASFEKGVLMIELPRTEEARSKIKHIDVKAA